MSNMQSNDSIHKATARKLENQENFLNAYAEVGHQGAACRIAGIAYGTVQVWKQDDESFIERFEFAKEMFDGTIHHEIIRRARDGYQEPLVHKGQIQYKRDPQTGELLLDDDLMPIVETITKKSDSLLAMAAKANIESYKPDKPEPVTVEVSGPEGEPIQNVIKVEFITPPVMKSDTESEEIE